MINVHTDLIRKELSKIGVDAVAVLLCITSHINPKRQAWPGSERLKKMTGLSRERTYKAIQKLIELKYISRYQENKDGEWGRVVYRVTSGYLTIFVNPSAYELESAPALENADSQPHDGNPYYANPYDGKPYDGNTESISIKQEGSISNKEVLVKGKSAPAGNETLPTSPLNTANNIDAHLNAKNNLLTMAAARKIDLPESKFAEAYFLNQQQRGHWYALTVPTDAGEVQLWLAKHIAGLKAWARREPSFRQGRGAGAKGGENETVTVKLPKI